MKPASDSFQHDFIRAIYGAEQDAAGDVAGLVRQAGFKVYRNTILKACVDALAANYPSVERLLGTECFRSAALLYARAEPPESVCLIEYGTHFADFLSGFAPLAGLPYLHGVAGLDRRWMACHIAADEPALDAGQLAAMPQEALLRSVLTPRAAVRWVWCDECPAYSIWHANRTAQPLPDELPWHGEGALLSRIDGAVTWQAASAGMCALLDACAAGDDLQAVVAAAQQCEPGCDIAALFSTLIQMQAFAVPVNPVPV